MISTVEKVLFLKSVPLFKEIPGEELAKVFYDIVEMEAFRGRRVLVVGGGTGMIMKVEPLAACTAPWNSQMGPRCPHASASRTIPNSGARPVPVPARRSGCSGLPSE